MKQWVWWPRTASTRLVALGLVTVLLLVTGAALMEVALAQQRDEGQGIIAQRQGQTASIASLQSPAPPRAPGDPALGKDYFSGARGFQNGGPACMACHGVAGIGALGGGAIGPELTGAFVKFGGEAALPVLLENVPFPTMRPIFATHPLTPEERADLTAFLKEAPLGTRPGDALLILAVVGVLGALAIAGLFQVIWRRRLAAVRKPMVGGMK